MIPALNTRPFYMMKRSLQLLIGAALLFAYFVLPTSFASAATRSTTTVGNTIAVGSTFTLKNQKSGRCLDADLNTIGSNGTYVQLWTCNNTPQQHWTLVEKAGVLSIQNVKSGRCLDADLNTIGYNGTRVQLWHCDYTPQQDWVMHYYLTKVVIQSNYRPYYRCLDADLNTIGFNGTAIQLWDCHDSAQQSWTSA